MSDKQRKYIIPSLINCSKDSVKICGEDAEGNVQSVQTDSTGRLDIRNLTCDDRVSTCGSSGVPIRTDAEGNIFANLNRTFVGDFQGDLQSNDEDFQCGNTYDISQVRSYAFYVHCITPSNIEALFQIAVDDTNFLTVQSVSVPGGGTIVFPSIKNPEEPVNTTLRYVGIGYPLPGKNARICYRGAGRVDLAFAAWK